MRDNPKPFEIYQHFKGNRYQILNIAKDSEDGHQIVVYQAMYGDYDIYARDLDMFMSPVDRDKYPDVAAEFRFTRIEKEVQETSVDTIVEKAEAPVDETVDEPEEIETSEIEASADEPEEISVSDSSEKESDVTTLDSEEEYQLDPMVEQFLEADSYTEKLDILAALHRRITEEMLQIMSVSSDIELNPGSVEDQYEELKNCLLTLDRFESDRRM